MPARLRTALLLPLLVGLPLAGCGTKGATSSGSKVAVKAGDHSCDVARTSFSPGSVGFAVQNVGSDTTEVYVYAKGGSGDFDKVVGEVENIAPGTSRDLAVAVSGGSYEIACKPGQKGDGIRTRITVSGPVASSGATAASDREVEVTATDYALTGLAGFRAKVGEKVELTLRNASTSHEHELEVFGPDGSSLGEVGPTKPGADGEVVLELKAAGTYRYESGVADDAARGMRGTFTVA